MQIVMNESTQKEDIQPTFVNILETSVIFSQKNTKPAMGLALVFMLLAHNIMGFGFLD